jgi:hypothetical protein
MSHIISDGWSLGVMSRELSALYNHHAAGREMSLAPLPIQYGDFARWQRQVLSGARLDRLVRHWTDRLRGAPTMLQLSTAYPEGYSSLAGGVCFVGFEGDFVRRLGELGRTCGATLFMTLFAAYAALLSRVSGQDDLIIGAPVANRTVREVEPLIGFFVNVLPVRIRLADDPTFAELVGITRDALLDAYAHQEVPLDLIVKQINPPRAPGRHPLFQAAFTLQSQRQDDLDLVGLKVTKLGLEQVTPKYDLLMAFAPEPDGLGGLLEYKKGMFSAEAAHTLLARFRSILEQGCAAPGIRILDLALGDSLPQSDEESPAEIGDFQF